MLNTCTPNSAETRSVILVFFGQRHIDLPGVERPDEAVGSVTKSAYESMKCWCIRRCLDRRTRRIKRRRGERSRIDRDRMIVYPSRQEQGYSRNKVWSLRGLVVTVGELVGD